MTKREQRRAIVQALKSSGVEPKRAHSEAGYMLNRWSFPQVSLAVASHSRAEDPPTAAIAFLRECHGEAAA